MKIVDMHCHILPGIDDGSENMDKSLAMLRKATEQNIYSFIATPHASGRYPKSQPDRVKELCQELEKCAQKEISSQIRIRPGQELMWTEDMFRQLEEGKVLTLADSDHVLVEFLPTTPWSVIYRTAREFSMSPWRMILAHVERYRVLRQRNRAEELLETGVQYQMNYTSIEGKVFDKNARWCRGLLKKEWIDYLGTDMHDVSWRAPKTEAAMQWMERHLDNGYIEAICRKNIKKLIEEG